MVSEGSYVSRVRKTFQRNVVADVRGEVNGCELLQRLEVIQCRGTVGLSRKPVFGRIVDGKERFFPGDLPRELVENIVESVPGLAIRVLGSVDALVSQHDYEPALHPQDSDKVRQVVRRTDQPKVEALRTMEVDKFVRDRLYGDNLSKAIRQLLAVSIVNCARSLRGLIVCGGDLEMVRLFDSTGESNHLVGQREEYFACAVQCDGFKCEKIRSVSFSQPVSPAQLQFFTSKFLSDLSCKQSPIPVAYVVVGGLADSCSQELLFAVRKKWPIFVVEGSGGYAEYLSLLVQRIEEICPNPSIDDYRSILASGDPVAAEILINGAVTIVSPGSNVQEFQHAVLFSLRGDDTLRQAWTHYSHWHYNESLYSFSTKAFQLIILLLGIWTMTLTILQSFLQLLYPNMLNNAHIQTHTKSETIVRVFMLANNLALIILPILTSLFQAILFKLDPASKFVVLRRCSQLMLREIYLYRTETRAYSQSAVNRQRQAFVHRAFQDSIEGEEESGDEQSTHDGKTATDIDDSLLDNWENNEGYFSKQDLLFRRIESLSKEVSVGIGDSPLWEYHGSVPSQHIINSGDDGFSTLSPEMYVKVRLDAAQSYYVSSSWWFRLQFNALTYAVYAFGSLGTMLAAFAVYGSVKQFDLQFWVALTTSVQNALSRFLDYSRVEHLMQEHSKAKEQLTNVTHWWSQLQQPGIQTDSQVHRDSLVGKVETCITREVEVSGSHMKNLVARVQKAQDQQSAQTENLVRDLMAQGNEEMLASALGIGQLKTGNVLAALHDPSCPTSTKIIQVLERIEEVNDMKPLEADQLEKIRAGELITKNAAIDNLLSEGLRSCGDWLPIDIRNILLDRKVLARFAEEVRLLPKRQVNRGTLMEVSRVKTELQTMLASFPLRRSLLVFKKLLEDLVVQQFEDSLKSMNVHLYNLVGTRSEANELLSELNNTVAAPDWHDQSLEVILTSIRDVDLQESIRSLGESTIRAMLKRAERFFVASSEAHALFSVMRFMAVIDVDELLCDPESTLERARLRQIMLMDPSFTRKRSKAELLEALPASLRQLDCVIQQSRAQLVAYYNEIVRGSLEFDLADCALSLLLKSKKDVPSFLRNSEGLCRFFFSICDIHHDNLFNVSQDITIRLMSVSLFYTHSLSNELRKCEILREFVSITRAVCSKSFHLKLFRQVCSYVAQVDVAAVFPSLRDRLCLVDMFLENFVDVESLESLSFQEQLLNFTPKIALRFRGLSVPQVSSILKSLAAVTTSCAAMVYLVNFFSDLLEDVEMTRVECTRLVHAAVRSSSSDSATPMPSDRVVATLLTRSSLRQLFSALQKCPFSHVTPSETVSMTSLYSFLSSAHDLGLISKHNWERTAFECVQVNGSRGTLFPVGALIEDKLEELDSELEAVRRFMFAEGPFIVFEAVADGCTSVDLTSIFPSSLQQYLFLFAAAKLRQTQVATEERYQELRAVTSDITFAPIFSMIRCMSEADITEALNAFDREIQNTTAFAQAVSQESFNSISGFSDFVVVHTRVAARIAFLKAVHCEEFVREQLFGCDVNLFVSALPDDRLNRLTQVIEDEAVSVTLSKLSAEEVRLFFSFLTALIDSVNCETARKRAREHASHTRLSDIL